VELISTQSYYASYLAFFTAQVSARGSAQTIEDYIFADSANKNEACMLLRFFAGLFASLITRFTRRLLNVFTL
jgi:Questin oxidase-like